MPRLQQPKKPTKTKCLTSRKGPLTDTKSLDSVKAITYVKAEVGPAFLSQLISKLTTVWDTANVKTLCTDVIQGGRRLRLVTITFDVDTYERYETTS